MGRLRGLGTPTGGLRTNLISCQFYCRDLLGQPINRPSKDTQTTTDAMTQCKVRRANEQWDRRTEGQTDKTTRQPHQTPVPAQHHNMHGTTHTQIQPNQVIQATQASNQPTDEQTNEDNEGTTTSPLRSFATSFVRHFVRSFATLFVRHFVRSPLRSLVRRFRFVRSPFATSFVCSSLRSFVTSFVRSFVHHFVRSSLRSVACSR